MRDCRRSGPGFPRPALVVIRCQLPRLGELQDQTVATRRADDLESDGKPRAGEATRDGDSGKSEQVPWREVAQKDEVGRGA